MTRPLSQFDAQELQAILDHAGSWKRFKEMTGISEKELQEIVAQSKLSQTKLLEWSMERLLSELTRIRSTALFCIIHSCKEHELRNRCESFGIDIKTICQPVGSTYGVGRKGENFFKQRRGDFILEDCFETQGHTHPFDFRDATYGLVNVKTASRQRFTSKKRSDNPNFWHFSTKGWKDCDHLAFVPLDPKGVPLMIIMVPTEAIGIHFPKHMVLTGRQLLTTSGLLTQVGPYLYLMLSSRMVKEQEPDLQSMEHLND